MDQGNEGKEGLREVGRLEGPREGWKDQIEELRMDGPR